MRFPRTTFAIIGMSMVGALMGAVAVPANSVPATSAAQSVLQADAACETKKMKVKKIQKVNEWNQGVDYFYRLKGKARLSGCGPVELAYGSALTKPLSYGSAYITWTVKKGNKYKFTADLGPNKGRTTILMWDEPSTGEQRAIYAKRGAKLLRTVPTWAQWQ